MWNNEESIRRKKNGFKLQSIQIHSNRNHREFLLNPNDNINPDLKCNSFLSEKSFQKKVQPFVSFLKLVVVATNLQTP